MKLEVLVTTNGKVEAFTFEDVTEYHVAVADPSVKPEWYDVVMSHLKAGKKVNAIKAHRVSTGMGLRESKALIDLMAEDVLAKRKYTPRW